MNIAVAQLLPSDWRAVAFVDAEVDFDNPLWAVETLKALTEGGAEVAQPFEAVSLAAPAGAAASTVLIPSATAYFEQASSLAHAPERDGAHSPYTTGFAWALSRRAFARLGGVFDAAVSDSGDNILAGAVFNDASLASGLLTEEGMHTRLHPEFVAAVTKYIAAAHPPASQPFVLARIAGTITHTSHGSLADRRYMSRHSIIAGMIPALHLTHRAADGLLVPTAAMPQEIIAGLGTYFRERREDDGVVRQRTCKIG